MADSSGSVPWPVWAFVTIVVALIGAWAVIQSTAQKGGTVAPGPGPVIPGKADPGPNREVTCGKIWVRAVAEQSTISPGGEASIVVTTVTSDGKWPVAGASVSLSVGGGTFVRSGTHIEAGTTDANGVYRATYRALDRSVFPGGPGHLNYGIGVTAEKSGCLPGEGETKVDVAW